MQAIHDNSPIGEKVKSLIGMKYGRLTVFGFAGRGKFSQRMWKCQCDCGECTVVSGGSLNNGDTRSCGCIKRESIGNVNRKRPISERDSPEMQSWLHMKGRCYNSANKSFSRYGGRGIKVCERWKNSFDHFLADMGRRPSPKHSIDRIDNNGNYEPGNCRWATKREQCNNRRSTILIAFSGQILSVTAWERVLGFKENSLGSRLRNGWSMFDAFSTPPGRGRKIFH